MQIVYIDKVLRKNVEDFFSIKIINDLNNGVVEPLSCFIVYGEAEGFILDDSQKIILEQDSERVEGTLKWFVNNINVPHYRNRANQMIASDDQLFFPNVRYSRDAYTIYKDRSDSNGLIVDNIDDTKNEYIWDYQCSPYVELIFEPNINHN